MVNDLWNIMTITMGNCYHDAQFPQQQPQICTESSIKRQPPLTRTPNRLLRFASLSFSPIAFALTFDLLENLGHTLSH